MAEDPIRKYSDAVKGLEKATGQVELLQGIFGRMYNHLMNPYKLMISNVSVKFPVSVSLGGGIRTFDAKDWPQIQQIAEALADLHSKRKAAEEAWHNLSDTDKGLLKPLPEKK